MLHFYVEHNDLRGTTNYKDLNKIDKHFLCTLFVGYKIHLYA